MDINNGPTRLRHRKSTSTERLLGAVSQPQRLANPTGISFDGIDDDGDGDLNEDDIFWTGDTVIETNHSTTPPSSSSSTPRRHHQSHLHGKGFAQHETFGILAALPENETSSSLRNASHFYHKASISPSSSSSSSSARMIPAIPKPPIERLPVPASSSSMRYQSAPVNVPMMSKVTPRQREFEEDDNEEEDGEMLPPHEIVARSLAQSPMLACSVLEGAGRTLKGRDLRQVRNAIWRRTGFLD